MPSIATQTWLSMEPADVEGRQWVALEEECPLRTADVEDSEREEAPDAREEGDDSEEDEKKDLPATLRVALFADPKQWPQHPPTTTTPLAANNTGGAAQRVISMQCQL